MKRLFWKVQRIFEPSRFAEDGLTDGYRKLVPIVSRKAARVAGPRAPGFRAVTQPKALKRSSGGVP
jgi:hypothetical protein